MFRWKYRQIGNNKFGRTCNLAKSSLLFWEDLQNFKKSYIICKISVQLHKQAFTSRVWTDSNTSLISEQNWVGSFFKLLNGEKWLLLWLILWQRRLRSLARYWGGWGILTRSNFAVIFFSYLIWNNWGVRPSIHYLICHCCGWYCDTKKASSGCRGSLARYWGRARNIGEAPPNG